LLQQTLWDTQQIADRYYLVEGPAEAARQDGGWLPGAHPTTPHPAGAAGWCGVDLRNIENNSARSGERAEAHSARLPAFLAAACVAGLDARQMRWALDYTAQQSSGIVAYAPKAHPERRSATIAALTASTGDVTGG
jgi:hypothetical protein